MSSSSLLVLAVLCFVSLISPAISQCSTQNLRTPLQTCLDLPVLNSSLHYTYNATNSSLSVAFIATPLSPTGWVAWAINPNLTGMAGSQAFVAHRSSNGSGVLVKTYDIRSYHELNQGRLSFDYWNLRVESMGDRIAIYTTVKVPVGAEKVNQVWQTGGAWNTSADRPGIHPVGPDSPNKKSVAELKLAGGGTGSSTSPPGNAGSMLRKVSFGVNFGVFVLLGCFLIF